LSFQGWSSRVGAGPNFAWASQPSVQRKFYKISKVWLIENCTISSIWRAESLPQSNYSMVSSSARDGALLMHRSNHDVASVRQDKQG
jgi:hypothetical protein